MIQIKCQQCGKEFESVFSANRKFCSRKCFFTYYKGNLKPPIMRGKNNPNWKGGEIILKCQICEKEFKVRPSEKNIAKFCSRKCKGKDFSKLLEGNKYCIGRNPWNKNKKGVMPTQCGFRKGHLPFPGTVEALQKWIKENGNWCKGKTNIYVKGEKNVNWKGGITPENEKERKKLEAKIWRRSIFERDNFTCQKYGIRGGKLRSHHIQNFAQFLELRFAIDNGITLSEKAHQEFHKIYGKKNNTREQLNEFLNK